MNTIVITHHNADLDALACLIAASKLYEGAIPVRGRSINPMVQRFLALHKDHFPLTPYQEIDPSWVERVIIVDVRDRRRLAEYEPILETNPHIVIWDHHPPCPDDVPGDEIHVEPTGSCATLLVEKLKENDLEPSPAEATLYMLGIYTDTGQLSFDNTRPRDIDAASYLLRAGGNLAVVNRYIQEQYSAAQQRLLVSMLSNCEEKSVDAVEVAIAIGSAPRFVRGASQVIHRIMLMGGHDAIFGIIHFIKDKRVQIIGRSRVPYVDIGQMLSEFGGGGHVGAGAATIKKAQPDDIVEQVYDLLEHTHLRPTRVSDIMSSPVQTIDHRATLADLEHLLNKHTIRGVPVLRDNKLVGIISIRDLERSKKQGLEMTLPVSSSMSHHVKTIPHDEPLEDALELMTSGDIGRLPVTGDDDRIIGIISRTDMLAKMYIDTQDDDFEPEIS